MFYSCLQRRCPEFGDIKIEPGRCSMRRRCYYLLWNVYGSMRKFRREIASFATNRHLRLPPKLPCNACNYSYLVCPQTARDPSPFLSLQNLVSGYECGRVCKSYIITFHVLHNSSQCIVVYCSMTLSYTNIAIVLYCLYVCMYV